MKRMSLSHSTDRTFCLLAGVLLTAVRLLLCQSLFIAFREGTQYDDLMQIGKAFSISNGNWLGEYGSMTLVKGVGFPLLTAFFHAVRLPYLVGWTLLWVLACCVFIRTLADIVPSPRQGTKDPYAYVLLLLYAFLLFCPVGFAADINRYYRDVGYYALAFLTVSLFLGMLLQKRKGVYAVLGGISLGLSVLTREDSHFLIAYAVGCLIAVCLLQLPALRAVLRQLVRCLLPAALGLAAVLLPVAAKNSAVYGTFTTDEYNSGLYAEAYGALSRLPGEQPDSRITIPEQQRMALYRESEAFAELYGYLDAPDALFAGWKDVQGDYCTGYFSFVLRHAAEYAGHFTSAAKANAYFERLAAEVNAYADTVPGALAPARGITARFYPEELPAILRSFGRGVISAVCYTGVDALPQPVDADDSYLKLFEDYTGSVCAARRYIDEDTTVENFHLSGLRLWGQRMIRVLILFYRYVTPILTAAALLLWILHTVRVFRRKIALPRWIAESSLLCVFLLRIAMLAYVDATTFSTINNPAYQAASYPLLTAFLLLTAAGVCQDCRARREQSSRERPPRSPLSDLNKSTR